ncbi:succinate dehydrogenase, hydrophobic membrane anchor protein [sulfur-oxidizing endosymbiont of Gigantopelta aegis]|uniref:succinate dehydrogenase, hydrophobic membrane anchor protein n=1 Tax=sulfur-oxidizing endosymbiont of Gigantopelta aegis TaxID=2794934 RepID=UPI0018DBDD1F|nr:succinate dehydrogenase, hydrophobic membrane anchor protein [sulfur-oxidizing endosymbiont of Gigantopelta aegis]
MTYQAKGLQAWLFQRLTAAFMALYILYFLGVILTTSEMTYVAWLEWFSHPLMNTASGLFFIHLAVHAWVGMRDIVLDYVSNDSLRLLSLTCISFFLIIISLGMLRILFSL